MAWLMAMNNDIRQVIDELAHATQILIGLASRLRENLGVANEDAIKLEAAVDRAGRALRTLQQPKE